MMTSKYGEHTLCSLLFETSENYEANLETLLLLVGQASKGSLLVAPEVCLTGFNYDDVEKAVDFASLAIDAIKKASLSKTIIFTMLEKVEDEIFNMAKVFHDGEVVHQRAKARLFHLGDEDKHMSQGKDEEVEIVEVDGIKIAVLVCFELRFTELWEKMKGADIIAVPSWWGVLRTQHFKSLTQSLAIINQCYVIASDSLNAECSKASSIITPKGEVVFNGDLPSLEVAYDKKEITLMRRYIDVGIK